MAGAEDRRGNNNTIIDLTQTNTQQTVVVKRKGGEGRAQAAMDDALVEKMFLQGETDTGGDSKNNDDAVDANQLKWVPPASRVDESADQHMRRKEGASDSDSYHGRRRSRHSHRRRSSRYQSKSRSRSRSAEREDRRKGERRHRHRRRDDDRKRKSVVIDPAVDQCREVAYLRQQHPWHRVLHLETVLLSEGIVEIDTGTNEHTKVKAVGRNGRSRPEDIVQGGSDLNLSRRPAFHCWGGWYQREI
ncbi:hypothetical protein QTG54_008383 [Skeletonema marinoi]|uniref:Uncharacterized protein n=1 Tax=Skeletonema marinoi TaxID=267567 RepID=A0AAD9DB81_9STRA|nr:hypothetical protein QTG54_008383 [Skeletonema marinoi]